MSYDDYLDRAIEESPDEAGSAARFSIPDPEVRTEGNVTVFENFRATVDRLGREASHVKKFLQNEVGTAASIDDAGRLRLTGSFRAERIADALEEYADSYVLCPECGLPDTKLETESGTEVRRCEACGARTPVDD
ncbi:translation initiation factor IF-2 subunit beta [Halorarius litoreus]|uniref:translation initiation factor IF-2 subunit beta n=1 Tax=Halorarius litoreus TaxID=2962676 RepID=UPI0020CFB4D6|nr:translation initiation factor IF-2 subunit beta [Halorarius litoreus]